MPIYMPSFQGTQTEQYKAVTSGETGAHEPLTVRAVNDIADNLNNYFYYVGNFKVLQVFCIPSWSSWLGVTDEVVICKFVGRYIPDGFTHLYFDVGHKRTAGTGSTTWRLYQHQWMYGGPYIMDTTWIGDYEVGTVTTTADAHTHDVSAMTPIHIGHYKLAWFTLTAENSDGSTTSALTTIDVDPQ